MSPIEKYRQKYGYLNDETLAVATVEMPSLLVDMINDGTIRDSTRADLLEVLGKDARQEYFSFIKGFTHYNSPMVQEGAYTGLFHYFESNSKEVREILEEGLKTNTDQAVLDQLKNLIHFADTY